MRAQITRYWSKDPLLVSRHFGKGCNHDISEFKFSWGEVPFQQLILEILSISFRANDPGLHRFCCNLPILPQDKCLIDDSWIFGLIAERRHLPPFGHRQELLPINNCAQQQSGDWLLRRGISGTAGSQLFQPVPQWCRRWVLKVIPVQQTMLTWAGATPPGKKNCNNEGLADQDFIHHNPPIHLLKASSRSIRFGPRN